MRRRPHRDLPPASYSASAAVGALRLRAVCAISGAIDGGTVDGAMRGVGEPGVCSREAGRSPPPAPPPPPRRR